MMVLIERVGEDWVVHQAERAPRQPELAPEPVRSVDLDAMFRKLDEGRQANAGRGEPGL